MDYVRLIGGFFLVYFFVLVTTRLYLGLPQDILWLSHIIVFVFGLGFLLRSSLLVTASFLFLVVPHTLWSLDYLLRILTLPSFGVTVYLEEVSWPVYVTTIHHLITVPLLLWGVFKLGVHKHAWVFAGVFFLVLSIITRLSSTPEYNINCVFEMCHVLSFIPTPPYYWFIMHLTVFLLLYVLNKVVFLLVNKYWVNK